MNAVMQITPPCVTLDTVHHMAKALCSAATVVEHQADVHAAEALSELIAAIVDAMGAVQDAAERDAADAAEQHQMSMEAFFARSGFRPDGQDLAMGWGLL